MDVSRIVLLSGLLAYTCAFGCRLSKLLLTDSFSLCDFRTFGFFFPAITFSCRGEVVRGRGGREEEGQEEKGEREIELGRAVVV